MAASGGYSEPIYLASYPRSGNTFLRMVLLNCFGLKTGSIYPADLGRNQALERFVGHIEHDAFGDIAFPQGNLPLLKTHELPRDDLPAIYIVRDGRAAARIPDGRFSPAHGGVRLDGLEQRGGVLGRERTPH